MADPLKIGVEVNLGDIPKLAEASREVAASVKSMAEQFLAGGMSAKDIAAAITDVSSKAIESNATIQQQVASLGELKAVLVGAQAAFKESSAMMAEAGGAAGVTTGFLKNMAVEAQNVKTAEVVLKEATGQVNAALAANVAGTAQATAAQAAQAAATTEGAAATARGAQETKAAAVAFSAEAQEAIAAGTAIVEGSNAVQIASQRFLKLQADLSILRGTLSQSKLAFAEAAVGTEQASAAANQYAATLAQVQLVQKEAAAAEQELKVALTDSYTTYQAAADAKINAAAQEAAATQQKQAASLAAADALAAETAANEGMVSSDIEAAVQENAVAEASLRRVQAQREGAAASQISATATQQHTAALAAQAPASQVAMSNAAKLAQSLMQAGMSAKDAQTALIGEGFAAKEAAAAMNELGVATAKTAVETEVATTKTDAMTRALAYSGVRLASNELGVGQLGFALARVGAISTTLAPILSAAFPVFAAFALFQIIQSLTKTMEEWKDISEKSAEENAKWERQVLKSADAADKMREKLAGLAGPLAEDAERLAHVGDKVIDVTSEMTELNKRIEDGPSLWKDFKEGVGTALVGALHLFDDAAQDAGRETEEFNRKLVTNIKTLKDLPNAIDEVSRRIRVLKEEQANINLAAFDPAVEADFSRRISLEEQFRTTLKNIQEASALETLSIQQNMSEKLFAAQTRAVLAHISLAETETKTIRKIHSETATEEMTELLRLNAERTSAELAEIDKRKKLLEERQKVEKDIDFTSQFKAFQEQRQTILTEGKRRELEIVTGTNTQILDNTLALSRAQIEAEEKVTLSRLKNVEAQQKITFSRADTPGAVEAAAIPLIRTVTEQYEEEARAIRATAAALLEKLTAERASAGLTTPKPTAELGTPEFLKQLESIKTIAPEVYIQLEKLNADEMALRNAGATAVLEIENEKTRKIREIRSQELTNIVGGLNDQLVEERTRYQDGAIALQAQLARRKDFWSSYYSAVKALAEQNYLEQLAILDREEDAVRAAADAHVITAEELARKLNAIDKRREEAVKETHKREEEAAKAAIEREEADINRVTNKISEDFVRMGHTLLTTHTSVGNAAKQLGRELELYIIEQGIRTVVTHYATSLLQMVASEAAAMARILGIHTAGAAAQGAITAASEAQQTAVQAAGVTQRKGIEGIWDAFLSLLGIKRVAQTTAQETAQTAAHTTAVTARKTVDTTATAADVAASTAANAAKVISDAGYTTAHAAGAAARTAADLGAVGAGLTATITSNVAQVISDAGTAAAAAFASVIEALPFPANVAAAPPVAAGVLAEVLSFIPIAAAAEGTVGTERQPVLVHSGEVITHSETLNALSSPASSTFTSSAASSHVMRVERDQISMLAPGAVVVPKTFARSLSAIVESVGGTIGIAPGETPPAGIREIPQRLPSGMTSTITSIINKQESATTIGGSAIEKIVTARDGFVYLSAKEGFVSSNAIRSARDGFSLNQSQRFASTSRDTISARDGYILSAREGYTITGALVSAAQGVVVPTNMATFTHTIAAGGLPGFPGAPGGAGGPGGPGGPGGSVGISRTVHNHLRLEMHNHGEPMTQEDVTMAVKRALRTGELSY